ncbi:MAG: hypothetical protein KGS72_24485 [Cyanobacteria bacterium REEB67]|nr:hypothetical protein [Cyanobacteria bacterium REEB67]
MNGKQFSRFFISIVVASLLLVTPGFYRSVDASPERKIGILYFLWHAPASASPRYRPSGTIFDNTQILAGDGTWGPVNTFHWWGKPDAGYYALAENDDLLRRHAEMLRDAGIDFVIVDSSNQPNQAGSRPMIIDPFDEMVKVWSEVPGAPKIVPWVPITGGGDMVEYFDSVMSSHPELSFSYKGKPLLLAVAPKSLPESSQFKQLAERFTIRLMWGLQKPEKLKSGEWSFLQPCAPNFRGNQPCNQCLSSRNGVPEQISVTAAYQRDYMSNTDPISRSVAVPKYGGLTFLRQLQTAYNHPEVPVITITGWNEWIAQRGHLPLRSGGADELPNGNKIFVDEYDVKYNRDLEPGGGLGDYYYKVLKRAIALLRAGQDPILALPSRRGD